MAKVGALIGRSAASAFLCDCRTEDPVAVDHPGGRAWLGPCLEVAVGFLGREGRAGVAQEVPEEMPVSLELI
jgi:hypothetical protein